MPKSATSRATASLALVLPLLCFGMACRTLSCPQAISPDDERVVMALYHSSGGLAPVIRVFYLFDDGRVGLEDPRGRVRCAELTPNDQGRLSALLSSPLFAEEMRRIREEVQVTVTDVEEILLLGRDIKRTKMIAEELPRSLDPLLVEIDRIIEVYFGPSKMFDLGGDRL